MPTPAGPGLHKRTLLRDDVFETLRDAIVDGTYAPGERLRDAELGEWLGGGRTPARAALPRLGHVGLVIALPGRATIVAPYDSASTTSTQQVVAAMHELAARLAVPVLTPAEIEEMVVANESFERALMDLDVEAALSSDDAFHAVFVTASRNPVIGEVLEQTTPVIRRVERMRFSTFAARGSVAQHAHIIDLARQGDADGAALATRENWMSLRFTAEE
ncbi:GntR family transcriptional regulator [Arthrobacter sp. RIT-PI-e]|uniref:GntR family transcriptional regulator n=1 Tax=Arthrobacter sp. RIT-PI-e TaxID=1681197 RepID=UPI000675F965|nr:GntR family transcriptional regulator [Arthrobacter sp. RIT-PI-e]KNC20130.1 GntR family transcriptional regulator [Arthrobacter sp. RIT-PI-e]